MTALSALEYVFPSRHRRALLKLLMREEGLTVRQLAKRLEMTYSNAHREIGRLRDADLVAAVPEGTALRCRWNRDHDMAGVLESLLAPASDEDDEDEVFSNLKRWHAPLSRMADNPKALSLEETLARSLPLARRHPEVARAWPVALAKNLHLVNFTELERAARRLGEKQALGFLVSLTADLLRDESLRRRARPLADARIRKTRDFFLMPQGERARRLADENTPPAARKWGFRMNLSEDSFRSLFRKFVPTHGPVSKR